MSDDELSEVRSRYLGFIFQSYNLMPQYTVVENIEVPLLYQGCQLDDGDARALHLAWPRWSAWATGSTTGRCSSPAASSSAWPSPARWSTTRTSSSPTSRPATSTRTTSDEIMEMLDRLNEAGKTIIMVTHENDIAAWAKRVIRMRDGRDRDRRAQRTAGRPAGSAAGDGRRSSADDLTRLPADLPTSGDAPHCSDDRPHPRRRTRSSLGQGPAQPRCWRCAACWLHKLRAVPVGAGHHHRHGGGDRADGLRRRHACRTPWTTSSARARPTSSSAASSRPTTRPPAAGAPASPTTA